MLKTIPKQIMTTKFLLSFIFVGSRFPGGLNPLNNSNYNQKACTYSPLRAGFIAQAGRGCDG